MAQPTKNILVIGAGELGGAVVHALTKHKDRGQAAISVMLRPQSISNPSAAKKAELDGFRSLAIDLVPADLEANSQDKLSSVFTGFDTVVSCSGMTGSAGLQTKIAKAALDAKVRRFVPWQYGVDYDVIGRGSAQNLFTEQLDVRDILRGQEGMQWLIFTVGVFMSFIFEPGFGMVDLDTSTARAFGSWDNRLTATTVEDIGTVVAEAVFNPQVQWAGGGGAQDGIVFVSGDTLSYREMADAVERGTGRHFERELWTLDFMKERLAQDPEDGFKKYGVIWAEAVGVAWDKETSFNETHSLRMTTVRRWLEAHKS